MHEKRQKQASWVITPSFSSLLAPLCQIRTRQSRGREPFKLYQGLKSDDTASAVWMRKSDHCTDSAALPERDKAGDYWSDSWQCPACSSLRWANRQTQVVTGDQRQGLGWLGVRWPETRQTWADHLSQAWHWQPDTRDTGLRLKTVTLRLSLTQPMMVARKFTQNS